MSNPSGKVKEKRAKYKVGQSVVMKGNPRDIFIIKEVEKHGLGYCDCCPTVDLYFIYRLTSSFFVNEDQLNLLEN